MAFRPLRYLALCTRIGSNDGGRRTAILYTRLQTWARATTSRTAVAAACPAALRQPSPDTPFIGRLRFAALIYVLLLSHSSALAHPRACAEYYPSSSDAVHGSGGLTDADIGVLSNSAYFVRNDHSYPVDTFSDTAWGDESHPFQCFRYEVLNDGTTALLSLSWPLAGIQTSKLDNIYPHDRISKVIEKFIIYPPVAIESELLAFESGKIHTHAWAPNTNSSALHSTVRIRYVNVDSIVPDVSRLLERAGFPTARITMIQLPHNYTALPQLSNTYSRGDLFLHVWSDVEFDTENVEFNYEVKASRLPEGARVYTPALTAAQLLDEGVGTLATYELFLRKFNELREEGPEPGRTEEQYVHTIEIAGNKLPEQSVFLVNMPLIVDTADYRDCVLVAAYFPFAIEFSLNKCF